MNWVLYWRWRVNTVLWENLILSGKRVYDCIILPLTFSLYRKPDFTFGPIGPPPPDAPPAPPPGPEEPPPPTKPAWRNIYQRPSRKKRGAAQPQPEPAVTQEPPPPRIQSWATWQRMYLSFVILIWDANDVNNSQSSLCAHSTPANGGAALGSATSRAFSGSVWTEVASRHL